MRKKKRSKKLFISTFTFLLFMLSLTTAFADTARTVNITGKHEINGTDLSLNGRFYFALISYDSAPMPDGSELGVKEVSAEPGGSFDFGEISYDRPGVYRYMVKRLSDSYDDFEGLKADDSEYYVTVTVFEEGEPVITITKEGSDGKAEGITYTDSMVSPKNKGKAVKTGDTTDIGAFSLMLTAAVLALTFLVTFVLKGEKD